MLVGRRERRAAEAFAVALESGAGADPLVRLATRLSAVPLRSASQLSGAAGTPLFAAGLGGAAATLPAAAPLAAPAVAPAISSVLPAWAAGPVVQAVTGVLAVAVAVTGAGIGASRSLPGDPLYGIKRAVERLQTELADTPVDEGVLSLDHVETRVDELLGMLTDNGAGSLDVDQVRATLRALDAELRRGTALLLDAARTGATHAAQDLIEFTDAQVARLNALLPALPLLLRVDVAHTLQLLEAAKAAAIPVSGNPVPGVPVTPPVAPPSGAPATTKPASPGPAPSGSASPTRPASPAPTGTSGASSASPAPSLPVPLPTPLLGG